MTLETAKRIVLEQGKDSNKEAQAVVSGGMTICEITTDGRRTYPWIKVLPTKTDVESSIEQALELWRATKMASNKKIQPKQEPVISPVKTPEVISIQVSNEEESPNEKDLFSIYSIISKWKLRLQELWKVLDEIVVE